ncbi:hypothetical protein EVG20_g311 [Dentipellis fragilis]|uniref:NAD(P)-binding protein n=1 Tax=Dentipellis fragilis TaxID=205917 RepID=A0A4Y9ZEX8_9AGAM|nr:hypothetical protein EVG20_g311 [Dentipellis fragilis]
MLYTLEFHRENHERPLPALEHYDLTGQVIIITGANAGIGYECARYILAKGATKVIAACRNEKKSQEAIRKLLSETKREEGAVEYWHLELASLASVRAFAKRFLESGLPLNTLISNAAISEIGKVLTTDGLDALVQINHISPMYLAMLLYPALKRTGAVEGGPPSRFIGVTTEGAFFTGFPESADPRPVKTVSERVYDASEEDVSYFTSKILNLIGCLEIARRIPPSVNIKVAVATPGLTDTELGTKDATGEQTRIEPIREVYGTKPRTCAEGARAVLLPMTYPAERVWPEDGGIMPFYAHMQALQLKDFPVKAQDEEIRRKVWEDTIALLQLKRGDVDDCFL